MFTPVHRQNMMVPVHHNKRLSMAAVFLLLTCSVLHLSSGTMVNLALGKPTRAVVLAPGYNASTAVDGNTLANSVDPGIIILTETGQTSAWWTVDLEREVRDATVRIYFRTNYAPRRNGVQLYTSTSPFSGQGTSDQLCHTVRGRPNGGDINSTYTVTCTSRWRYLLLYTDSNNDGQGAVLDFGEVEVFECESGFYGSGCSLSCGDRQCLVSSPECDHVTGQCVGGCQAGYNGTDCKQTCESGTYGPACSLSCNDRKCINPSNGCDHVTGQCVGGCQTGYNGTDCRQTCSPGVNYGVNCEKSCSSRHCMTSPRMCDPQTGQCPDGCEPGWTGVDCTSRTKTSEQDRSSVTSVVGAVVGTFFVVVLLGAGILFCLIRQGRLKWVKGPEGNKPVLMSGDGIQGNSIAIAPTPPPRDSEPALSSRRDMNSNDNALTDSENTSVKNVYDVPYEDKLPQTNYYMKLES